MPCGKLKSLKASFYLPAIINNIAVIQVIVNYIELKTQSLVSSAQVDYPEEKMSESHNLFSSSESEIETIS